MYNFYSGQKVMIIGGRKKYHGEIVIIDSITGSVKPFHYLVNLENNKQLVFHNDELSPFISDYICHDCAIRLNGSWPDGHCATSHVNVCEYCGNEKGVTNIGDWDWSDGKHRGMRD